MSTAKNVSTLADTLKATHLDGYEYPPNDYTGEIRFDRIDERILWAEFESTKPEGSRRWGQDMWVGMTDDGFAGMADSRGFLPKDTTFEQIECKTAFCIAGSAAIQAGWKPVLRHYDGGVRMDAGYLQKDGETKIADEIAMDWFGVEQGSDASTFIDGMFGGGNSLSMIKGYRDSLAASVGFPTRWR